jgi:Kef-type K+ transport system membrane component KefB
MPDVVLLIGFAILTGYIAGMICKTINQPQVVGWILAGVFFGSSGIELLDTELLDALEPIIFVVLSLIGFDIGGELNISMLRRLGKSITIISIFEGVGAFILVTAAVTLLTGELWIGLIFGGISVATAPAATTDVLREYRSSGPLTSTVFAVVGIDDVIAIIIYALAAGFAVELLLGGSISFLGMLLGPLKEIFGALILGGAVGVLYAYVSKVTNGKMETLLLSFGTILVVCGLARQMGFSYILASMAMGVVFVNLPFSNKKCFKLVNDAKPPLYILFFIFVGARLQVDLLFKIGAIGVLYIIFRTAGKGAGSLLGAKISGKLGYLDREAREPIEKYFWLCLFSQAGVAIGLAIEAMHTFSEIGGAGPEFGTTVITIITGTTLVLNIIGPPSVRHAIVRSGEAGKIRGD